MNVIPGDFLNIAFCLLITIAQQMMFFLVGVSFKTDKVTDFSGGTNFLLLAVLTFFLNGKYGVNSILITIFIVLWGIRLSVYLFYRILKIGVDHRFDPGTPFARDSFFKFGKFWIGQVIWVFTVSLPIIFANGYGSEIGSTVFVVNAADVIGWVMMFVGLLVETASDMQKYSFRNNAENRGKFCNIGMWKFSRHPNYWGEMTFWFGIWLAASSATQFNPILTPVSLLSPLLTSVLLLFVTGIPILEESSDKRYGSQSDYTEYKQRTSPLIPCPPTLWLALPKGLKSIIFEWEMYSVNSSNSKSKNSGSDTDVHDSDAPSSTESNESDNV